MLEEQPLKHPQVFISYSHDSPGHAERVLGFSDNLRTRGIDTILDQYEENPPEGWPRWMDKKIKDADFILMVCTKTYYHRVMGEEEQGNGQGVVWEGNLIYQHIYNANTTNRRFIPVLFPKNSKEYIPTPLQGTTHYFTSSATIDEKLYRRLTNQHYSPEPELGRLKFLPVKKRGRSVPYLSDCSVYEKKRCLQGEVVRVGEHRDQISEVDITVTIKETNDSDTTNSHGIFRVFLKNILKYGQTNVKILQKLLE